MSVEEPRARAGRLAMTPGIAGAIAMALLVVSLLIAVMNERAAQANTEREAQVQANILGSSVAGPLAFDDRVSTQEYLDALGANPAVEVAGAYDARNRLTAAFHRRGEDPPHTIRMASPVFKHGKLIVTAPALQGTTRLGAVYLRVSTEGAARRLSRYFPIGVILVISSLLVGMLGAAHGRLRREVAERERAEEALRQSQKMEAMGQLTGGVAHDFNNLLMVASSGLDLLERTSDPVRQERLKKGIREAIERGAALTQQLLAFARRAPVRPEVVDLRAKLLGMGDLLDRSLRENITVTLQPEPDLWAVEVDPTQLEVAILNTAINARDAMPSGGTVTITAHNEPAAASGRSDDRVKICIADTGVGLSPELANRVFEPFFTTKGVGKGTGLGLSQV